MSDDSLSLLLQLHATATAVDSFSPKNDYGANESGDRLLRLRL